MEAGRGSNAVAIFESQLQIWHLRRQQSPNDPNHEVGELQG